MDSAQVHRDGIRKAETQLDLNLAKNVNNITKSYIDQKRKNKEGACFSQSLSIFIDSLATEVYL